MSGLPSPFPPVPPIGHVTTMRAAFPQFVGVFVEGTDDVEMWKRWLVYEPIACDGCVGVRRAIEDLRTSGLNGCVGIIDADLARITNCLLSDSDLVVSDKHDHECDLVCSPAMDALIASFPSDSEQALSALIAPHTKLRDAICERALHFGILRWIFHERRQEYPSRLLPSNSRIVAHNTWTIDLDELLSVAAQELSISRSELELVVAQRRGSIVDEWQVCNGHDVVSLMHRVFSTHPGTAARCRSEMSVGWALRFALDSAHLQCFSMWQQLEAWEANNPPWRARK